MKFSYTTEKIDSNTISLKLSGALDENARLPRDLNALTFDHLIVDFKEVELINSSGIKLWMQFLDHLSQNIRLKFSYFHCTPMIVNQINLILGFLPESGVVESLYVPIICTKCDRGFTILKTHLDPEENLKDFSYYVQDIDCDSYPTCKRYLDVDTDPHHYLEFLRRT